ncbi:MAG: hypothetical protein IJU78_08045 [Clostridia bacterium]|nr:hypothetical protein [Clostridia bacterium]
MKDDGAALGKRLSELAERADRQGRAICSEFLDLAEQDVLLRLRLRVPHVLYGGCEAAERRVAVFGAEEPTGGELALLRIAPLNARFADELTHRDFLGALMSLGVRRSTLGDIFTDGSEAYLFCLPSVAALIIDELSEVRRTRISVTRAAAVPEGLAAPPEPQSITLASGRLDAAVAAIYDLSRSESAELFEARRVFVNSRLTENRAAELRAGDIVSVRGLGRFVWEGINGEIRRGRLRATVRIYGR